MRVVTEAMMREALDGKFTYYVGRPQADSTWPGKRELLRKQRETRKHEQDIARQAQAKRELVEAQKKRTAIEEPAAQLVLAAVAVTHKVLVDDILGPSRKQTIAVARHHAAWEMHQRISAYSKSKIGLVLGHRDHTTVINSLGFFEHNRHRYRAEVEAVARLLTNGQK